MPRARSLINDAILTAWAAREGNAPELAARFGVTVAAVNSAVKNARSRGDPRAAAMSNAERSEVAAAATAAAWQDDRRHARLNNMRKAHGSYFHFQPANGAWLSDLSLDETTLDDIEGLGMDSI